MSQEAAAGGRKGKRGYSSEPAEGQVHRGPRCPQHIPDSVQKGDETASVQTQVPRVPRGWEAIDADVSGGGPGPSELPHTPGEPRSCSSLLGSSFLPDPSAQVPTLYPRPPVETCLPLTLQPDARGSPRPTADLDTRVKVTEGDGKLLF